MTEIREGVQAYSETSDGQAANTARMFSTPGSPAPYPPVGFHVAISYPTNPEVLEGSDLSRAPVPDWSASIFPTPRPTRPPPLPSRGWCPYARPRYHNDSGGVGGSVVLSRLVRYHIQSRLPIVCQQPPSTEPYTVISAVHVRHFYNRNS